MKRSTVRRCALALSVALLAAGCGTSSQLSTSGDGEANPQAPSATVPAEEPAPTADPPDDAEEAPTPTAVPGTRPPLGVDELDDLLLDDRDLGGADLIGPMTFSDEPQYEFVDCEPIDDLFAAHAATGRRIRSPLGDGALRMSAVDLGDHAAAAAVLDTADSVWDACSLVTTDSGDTWWLEPLEMPLVDGWRVSGLAIGLSELIWTIGWYQRGGVVVFADYDAASPWDMRTELDAAIAARLMGSSDPVEPPGEPPVIQPAPTPTPDPTATPLPRPTPTPDTSWLEHPAVRYVPAADFFGQGWTRELREVVEAAPSDPDDFIEGCDVAPPPAMDGLEVIYEPPSRADGDDADSLGVEVEVMVGVGDADAAAATMLAFGLVAGCHPDTLDGLTLEVVAVEPGVAEEVVALDIGGLDDALEGGVVIGHIVLARYGSDLIGVFYGGVFAEGTAPQTPEVAEIARWIDQWVADADD